jgi:inorganic phosphate transporter, PiT family
MSGNLVLVVAIVVVALVFNVINGFHDAANSIATVVSTRVLSPRVAVWWAAFFNFAAMLVFAPKVADTISKIVRIKPGDPVFVHVILAGLLGAIAWDLFTWWRGLPISSSHALIGGFAGAGVTALGLGALHWELLLVTVEFMVLAPLLGFVLGSVFMIGVSWVFRRWRPAAIDKVFRRGQLFSAAMYSLGHGGNDAQKTMGMIMALLVAAGYLGPEVELSLFDLRTLWIILTCQAAMALGTAFGGWRIVRTMGMKVTRLRPVGGCCAETAGAITIFLATFWGIPVSTTHTITGAIVGVGSTARASAVKWGVALEIIWAWLFTIPASAVIAAGCFFLAHRLIPAF